LNPKSLKSLIDKANELDGEDESIDMVFNIVHPLLKNSEVHVVDEYFKSLKECEYETDTLIALLTITGLCRYLFLYREKVLENTRKIISERKETEDDLLIGL